MKHIILIIALSFSAKSVNAQGYHIKGKVVGIKDSTMILLRNSERGLPFDTTYVFNGYFEFKGNVTDNSEMFFIRTTPYKRHLSKRFFVENTKISIVLNEVETDINIIGGTLQNQSNTYESYLRDSSKDENLGFKDRLDRSIQYIKSHEDEEFTAYLINELRINLKNEEVKELFDGLDDTVKQSKYGKIVENYLNKSVDFTKGTPITDFTLKDLNGNDVSLSSFKGKHVLLDFWGSWCGSCRSKYPEYSKIYEKYKDKGFEIVGVSLDKDEAKWKRAVAKDNIHWVNLVDPSGFLGDIAVTYKVWTVPMAYFIDPEGKIIEPITFSPFTEEKLKKALNLE